MNSQEKQPLLQNKILNPEEIKCKKYYLQDEILIPGKMNCQEKQPLLKEKEIIPEKELSHNRKWMSLVALLTISYLMIQAGAIMMYVINEYIHHRIKETMVTNTSSSLDTSSCSNINKSSEIYKNLTRVQQTAAQFVMYCNIAEYIPAFFSSLILSAYTDKYGRKFVIITCLVGYFLSRGLILWVIYTKQSLSFIVLAYVLEGCTGAFYTFFSSAFSAIADLFKDKKQRVLAVISIEFTSMLAISVSGVLSGVMVEDLGYTYTGVICVGLFSLPLILAIFLLPETLGKENRTNPDSIIGILKRPFEFYTSSTFKGKRLMFSVFVLAFGVAELSSLNRTSLETVYFLGTPFCWSPKKIGYFTSARHFGQGVIGLGSVKLMQKCWSNEFIAILSTVSGGASFIIEGLATTELMVYMGKCI